MGMTIAEKIIAAAAGVESVKPGDIHTVTLDRLMSNDGTTHLTVDMYRNKLKNPHIADAKKVVFIVDHNVPSDCPKTAASQKKMRDFAKENNVSTSTLRNRLRENYGYDYFKKLMKNDNNKKMVQLYENGFSINQIAKNLRTKCRLYKKRNK